MSKYILIAAAFVIVGGFIGCLVGGAIDGPTAASTGTGFGCLVGAIVATVYYLTTKDSTPAA